MSDIVQQVSEDLKTSMKARDAARTSALRMVRAAFIEAQKAGKGEVTDDDAVGILRRLRKQRIDAAQQYEKVGAEERAASERAEVTIIDGYLPQLADEATTLAWVQEALAATGASSPREFGKAMGALMRAHRGDVDAGLAKRLLQAELAS